MADKTVLVTGARGQIGRYVAQQFARTPGWRAIGLSRSAPEFGVDFEHLSVDLLDPKDCQEKIGAISGITHLVHAAFQPRANDADAVAVNVAMLANFVEAAEAASEGIEHVTLMTGARAYGSHLGAFKTPSEETDPTHFPPNFYF
ncbi:MAG: NAD-dependent epimerase/dehydratase family protein, partial [Rhodospirillaceae bacterium]|nr:NAD-dependent epimerase/dehydratase family protein [Rhodospirillaceae bacterium]